MRELGPTARRLLALDEEHGRPSDAQTGRVHDAVLARMAEAATLGAAAGVASKIAGTAAPGGATVGVSGGLGLKLAVTLAIGIGIGSATTTVYFHEAKRQAATPVGTVAGSSQPPKRAPSVVSPPPVETAASPPSVDVPSLSPPPVLPFALPRRAASIHRDDRAVTVPGSAPVASTTLSSERSDTTAAEFTLLRDAKLALRDGDAARALSLLNQHADRFPSGTLSEERDALRIETLCALQRSSEAASRKETFVREHPQSPLAPAVRRSCGGP